jgi:hypothetical protein
MYSYNKASILNADRYRAERLADGIAYDVKRKIAKPSYTTYFGNIEPTKCQELYSTVDDELKKLIVDYDLEMNIIDKACINNYLISFNRSVKVVKSLNDFLYSSKRNCCSAIVDLSCAFSCCNSVICCD